MSLEAKVFLTIIHHVTLLFDRRKFTRMEIGCTAILSPSTKEWNFLAFLSKFQRISSYSLKNLLVVLMVLISLSDGWRGTKVGEHNTWGCFATSLNGWSFHCRKLKKGMRDRSLNPTQTRWEGLSGWSLLWSFDTHSGSQGHQLLQAHWIQGGFRGNVR